MADQKYTRTGEQSPSNAGVPFLYQTGTESELLSANHLFTVEILSLKESSWSKGADGLEHRRLEMSVKLLETFKGVLDNHPNQTFSLEVEQRRESEFSESGFYGLWSHIRPKVGARYLVFGNSTSNAPAALMQEGGCERLLGSEYIPDVRLAIQAENLFQQTLRAHQGEGAELAAAHALLRFSTEKRSQAKDLFARYLWARVSLTFNQSESHLLPEVLKLIAAADGDAEFRSSLISDLYDAVVNLHSNPELTRRVLKAFFALLLQKEASPLHSHLVDVELYGLAFQGEKPEFRIEAIFPDVKERERIKAVLIQFDSERARALTAWLSSHS